MSTDAEKATAKAEKHTHTPAEAQLGRLQGRRKGSQAA